MSVRVMSKVWSYSEATEGARLVILALADSAQDDGVTWIAQEDLAAKARLSTRQVRRVLDWLIEAGEIEQRKVQLKLRPGDRRRINVYRVTFAGIEEPNYERLPFSLPEPFSRPDNMSSRNDMTTGHLEPLRPDIGVTPPARATMDVGSKVLGSKHFNRKGPVRETPPTVKIGGRNLPFDALQAVDPGSSDKQIAVALRTIREEFWREVLEEQGRRDGLDVPTDFETFERALAAAIPHRAKIYADRWPNVELTATALAKHWRRMALPGPQRKQTAREILDAVMAEDDE